MNVLVIDIENLGLDFVLRASFAGHKVKWFLMPQKGKKLRDGEGFTGFEIVDDWKPHMKWAKEGLILITGNFKFMAELDRYRDLGFKIFGPTAKSAELEIKRAVGMKAMEEAGIEVPAYKVFSSFQEAERHARKSDKCYVFKPMGSEEDKSLSFVSCDPAEMVGWIRRQIEKGTKLKGQCMLQEKIDMLMEIGVSAWYGENGFLPEKFQTCFEHKKLMAGEIGPNTGEQGTVTQYVERDKLADELLVPLAGVLKRTGHRGDFAIGAGIDSKGKAWPFEVTARLGWPAFYIEVASHKGDPVQWMRDLLDGKDSLKVSRDVAIGVVMTLPPYPYPDIPPELVEGLPISGIEDEYDNVHMASVMLGKGPIMKGGKVVDGLTHQTTGAYVLVTTGLGKTVEKAQNAVYETTEKIKFPDAQWRDDIGEKVIDKLDELHRFGYAKDMEP